MPRTAKRIRPNYSAPDDFQEDENDFKILGNARPILYSTDWTSGTAVNQIKRKVIDLDPRFQRRDAWSQADKSKFIESLSLHIPIPQIILAEHPHERGKYIVIDGKQRLLTLVQFIPADGDVEKRYETLRLTGLSEREDLNGKLFEDIRETEDGSSIENAVIRTVIINGVKDENFLYEVFLRLNTLGKSLSPQELRQALAPGQFTNFLDDAASESEIIRSVLNIEKPDRRMRDNELLLRFIAFRLHLGSYDGNFKRFMDDTTRKGNRQWSTDAPDYQDLILEMNEAVRLTFAIFGQNAFQSFDSNKYTGRFNRAVFDIMTYFFADSRVREASAGCGPQIESSFRELCSNDSVFRNQLSVNTKEVSNVHIRYSTWARVLSTAISITLPRFELNEIGNRIVISE